MIKPYKKYHECISKDILIILISDKNVDNIYMTIYDIRLTLKVK